MQANIDSWLKSLGYSFQIDQAKSPNRFYDWRDEDGERKGRYIVRELGHDVVTVWFIDYVENYSAFKEFGAEKLSSDERSELEAQRKKLDREIEADTYRENLEVQKYALAEWDAQEFTTEHPYLTTKKVRAPDGCLKIRQKDVVYGPQLMCPMYSADGVMWGYQIIDPEHPNPKRRKRYQAGQRAAGCFTPLGQLSGAKRIYVTEGVATGLTCFEAFGGQSVVVCAMSAPNLLPVARALRGEYPKLPIIILADNDQWKGPSNAGVKAAEEARAEVDGVTVGVPQFEACHVEHFQSQFHKKPTDFNDLHVIGGLDVVKEQVNAVEIERPEYFWPLGFKGKTFYFTTLLNPDVIEVEGFSTTDMFRLLSLRKWKRLYPEHVNKSGKIDWDPIKSDLMMKAMKKGRFETEDARGTGIYLEAGVPVVHLGDRVLHGADEIYIQDLEFKTYYKPTKKRELPPRVDAKSDLEQVLQALQGYKWEVDLSPELLLGWCYCAFVSGAINWRPHILLSGKAGKGKTTIVNEVVKSIILHSGFFATTDASEAGVRQTLENDAVPVIYDEFDTNKGRAADGTINPMQVNKLQGFLNLCRVASSGGTLSRGTPGHKAMQFTARFAALMAGISPPALHEADQSRITELVIQAPNESKPWPELERHILDITGENLSAHVFWQVVDSLPNFKTTHDIFHRTMAGYTSREGQQWGALLAGYWHLFHVEQITEADADTLFKRLTASMTRGDQKIGHADHSMLLYSRLLQMKLRCAVGEGVRELSIADIIREIDQAERDPARKDAKVYEMELANAGLRIGGGVCFMMNNSEALNQYFRGTNYMQGFKGMPDARAKQRRLRDDPDSRHTFNPKGIEFPLPTFD